MTTMYSSSPSYQYPSTPAALRQPLYFRPLNSSPLADSPGKSSPVVAAQARRRSQYKAHAPTTPTSTRILPGVRRISGGSIGGSSNTASCSSNGQDDPTKISMRARFKARCFERAVKARERAIRGKRYAGHAGPDDFAMEDDDSEDDEDIMQDELFRRIMANANRQQQHSYRVSYAQEVGSSFDPDLEDIDTWEQELAASGSADPAGNHSSTSTIAAPLNLHSTPFFDQEEPEELTPYDLDDDELEAYAEECARRAAVEDFEDIPEEELFSWSDGEELGNSTQTPSCNGGDEMDTS